MWKALPSLLTVWSSRQGQSNESSFECNYKLLGYLPEDNGSDRHPNALDLGMNREAQGTWKCERLFQDSLVYYRKVLPVFIRDTRIISPMQCLKW